MKEYDFIPKVYKKEEVKNYPVFCKKDTDQGGRHAYKIENEDELKMYAKADMIICEYLPGEEVTVDCFTNKKRNLVFCNPRAADRILAGIDVHARRIDLTPEIKYIAESLNKDSREQFEQRTHKRLIDIITPTQKTVDALSRLEMPAGVYIDIKMKQK